MLYFYFYENVHACSVFAVSLHVTIDVWPVLAMLGPTWLSISLQESVLVLKHPAFFIVFSSVKAVYRGATHCNSTIDSARRGYNDCVAQQQYVY